MSDGEVTSEYGLRFWLAVVAGSGLMVWGFVLFLQSTPGFDERVNFALYIVGTDLAHDLLAAPAACLVGAVVARCAPAWMRAPLQVGLIATVSVLALVWLPLRGSATGARNPTIQPLDYTTATLTVLAVIWVAATIWAWYRWRS